MIAYEPGDWGVQFIFRINGSVLPRALVWGLSSCVTTVLLNLYAFGYYSVDGVTTLWGGYTTVLGFLVVFRNNEAYGRFWEGTALMYQVRGEWLNAGSSLIAFCSAKPDRRAEVRQFQEVLMRLMSMLHCSALQMIAEVADDTFEIISPIGMDMERVKFLMRSNNRTEIAVQWIQRSVVEACRSGVLDIPPPILSRVFQELSRGIVNLHNVRKIKEVPLPFPYAQTMSGMMLVHWILTPIIASQSMQSATLAGLLALGIQTAFWSIIYIAREIEQPFGDDNNDLPMPNMQMEFNDSLELLLNERVQTAPTYQEIHQEIIEGTDLDETLLRGRCSFGENHMEHAISSHRLSGGGPLPPGRGGGFFGARQFSPPSFPSAGQMFGTRQKCNAGLRDTTPQSQSRGTTPAFESQGNSPPLGTASRGSSPSVVSGTQAALVDPAAVGNSAFSTERKGSPGSQQAAPGDLDHGELQLPPRLTPGELPSFDPSSMSFPGSHVESQPADQRACPSPYLAVPPGNHPDASTTSFSSGSQAECGAGVGTPSFGFARAGKCLDAKDALTPDVELAEIPWQGGALPCEDDVAEVPGAKPTVIESPSSKTGGFYEVSTGNPSAGSPGVGSPQRNPNLACFGEVLSEAPPKDATGSEVRQASFMDAARSHASKSNRTVL